MWLTLLMRSLQLIPVLVAGIEHIHGEAPGATKKQMAMDALQLAWGGASMAMPDKQPAIDAATVLASKTIDGVVDVFNQAGIFKDLVKKDPPPAPSPAPIAQMPSGVAAAAAALVPALSDPAPAPLPPTRAGE